LSPQSAIAAGANTKPKTTELRRCQVLKNILTLQVIF
jgi:hypothetical protein